MRVFLDDALVYSCGQEGSYPAYMNDPPTILSEIPLPQEGGVFRLRVEYRSPTQRSELSVPVILAGSKDALLTRQFQNEGFPFLFSLFLIFLGVMMALISFGLIWRAQAGTVFLWLGLFSLASGVWGLGECDFSALLMPWPSLLYAMSYLGLFTVIIPFLRFGLIVLNPKNRLPMQVMLWVNGLSVGAAVLLQLTGLVDFTRSLFWFHIVAPFGFFVFAVCLVYEGVRRKNAAAKRFAPSILMLVASVLLELLNYRLRLVGQFTLFFQLGVLAFVLSLGVASGYYVRSSLQTAAERDRLEFEMAAMGRQLTLQRLQYRKLAENDAAVKAQRHDLRHQLAVLRKLNESGERDKLGGYIDTLIGKIPGEQGAVLCENYAVNAVAAHYCAMAEKTGAEVSVRLVVPKEIGRVLESDLCVIAGNLLENAVEACRRMEGGRRFIRMESRLQYGTLTIVMDNSDPGGTERQNGVFLSSKREGAGAGLSSVAAVARRYGGAARFESKDGVFLSSVYIRLDEGDEARSETGEEQHAGPNR